ncbi:MAG TPA: hypothetical protein VIM70_08860 [Clostridium sp.]|uniref:hypothetical protein n=1 Tax=Clostridium sp. TaxID=1506 RepID=UPI002F92B709
MSINGEFIKFINNNIILSQNDISIKVKSRQWVVDKVIARIKERTNCPQLYKEGGCEYIYYGSCFKGTKVSIIDEFDVMLIIDTNLGQLSLHGRKFADGVGIKNPNPKYNGNFNKGDNSGISPRKLMSWLKNTIDEALSPYGCEVCEKNGQAITVHIIMHNYYIDFVPGGIFKKTNTYDIFYNIPKGDSNGGWIETNPRIDKKILNDVSSLYTQFKNTIRLFKYIFKRSYHVTIGSYAIESCVIDYELTYVFYDDFQYDFANILNHIIGLVESDKIPDMRDNNINLLVNINKQATLMKLNNIMARYRNLDEYSYNFSDDVEVFLKNE